jgi:hypothetical protein
VDFEAFVIREERQPDLYHHFLHRFNQHLQFLNRFGKLITILFGWIVAGCDFSFPL